MSTNSSLHCHTGSLSDKTVFDFIAKGIVQSIQSNKTYEIEAKLKTFTAKSPQKIDYAEFNNAQAMSIRQLSSILTFEERSFFLLSFGFKDGFRLTYDAHSLEFILEIKDKNNEKNTLSLQQNGVNMNLSKKQETLVDDELILKEYIRKLTEGEFENVRIKVRKTYTTEHIERCFSRVIQLNNTPGAYRSYGFNKNPLETLLGKVKQFTITKKPQLGLQVFTFLFKQLYEQYVAYEIEVEVIDVKHYFEDLVKTKNKQLLTQKIHDFNESIEQIISNINAPLPLISKILGEYADKVYDSSQV